MAYPRKWQDNNTFITESPRTPYSLLLYDTFSPFISESPQFPDFSLPADTSSNNDYPFIANSPRIPEYALLDGTLDNMLNVDCSVYASTPASYDYGLESPSSSASPNVSPSFPAVYDLDSYENISSGYLPAPNVIDSPTSGTYPASYDYSSPSTSECSNTSDPTTAAGAFESGSDSISTYPTNLDYPAGLYDGAVDAPSNTSIAHIVSPSSTSYSSCLSGALGDLYFEEGRQTIDGTGESRSTSVAIFTPGNTDSRKFQHPIPSPARVSTRSQ